ncbi:sporulation protein YunB [Paenibacillus aurantius]|uniref:Sporulation protein YunB n=1 Tax=Paenibacillus aurantius TaxID=2918900 RepID=A0AA96RIT8_9BACL|nr:sporulation protein YunB [Paenibacillus aurantius]WNQ12539.1 sporulation protein YunB [Paenibacillus aurantius]
MTLVKRRWKSRPRSKSIKRNIFITLVILLLVSLQSFIYIEKNLKPPLMNLAKIRLKQLATQSINSAITDHIAQGTQFDKLIEWRTDNAGKTAGFMLNYAEHVKITADTVNRVNSTLANLKAMPEHIPLGQAMNSAILASFGPDIPIRLVPAGAAKVDLNTRSQNVGINMVLVEVYIRIIAEVTIIIPFDAEPEIVETELPISYVLVVGDTPMYYMDNKGNPVGGTLPPNVSLPNLSVGPGAAQGGSSGPSTMTGSGVTGSGASDKAGK